MSTWYKFAQSLDQLSDPNCPPQVLSETMHRLFATDMWRYKTKESNAIAEHKNTPPGDLAFIVEDALTKHSWNSHAAYLAAKNPNTPIPTLIKVMESTSNVMSVIHGSASNPNLPSKVIYDFLKRAGDSTAAIYAMENPNCPPEVFMDIFHAQNVEVANFMHQLAMDIDPLQGEHNKKTYPPDMLKAVIQSSLQSGFANNVLSRTVAHHPNCPPDALTMVLEESLDLNVYNDMVYFAACNPNTPEPILIKILQQNKDDSLSRLVADQPSAPQENVDLWRRNRDRELFDQSLQPKNPMTDKEWWKSRSAQSCQTWCKSAQADQTQSSQLSAKNPNCSPKTLTQILERHIKSRSKGRDPEAEFAAAHKNCPPEILTKILLQKNLLNGSVVGYAAENPNVPQEILIAILQGDPRFTIWIEEAASFNPSAPPEYVELRRRNIERNIFDYELKS